MGNVESWIDEICRLVGEVEDGRGGHVRSYSLFAKNEFPAALTEYPCALTYPEDVSINTSDAGPNLEIWRGRTEFHLTPGADKDKLPEILRYFARIRNAFALHRNLGGKVSFCLLRGGEGVVSIEGPVRLQYGDESPHLGLIAYWEVKVDVTGQFTLGL